jgi:Uma2 family endonuclease
MTTFADIDLDQLFPDSDGKPIADNTVQFGWIVVIKENLEILFANNPDVFVAGDLLWYPLKSTLVAPTAPDAMVVFGRPKGRRGSYRQWLEDDIPPQVVFEIRSPSNTDAEMARKQEFYDTYGVEEYYLYDPDCIQLKGWYRQQGHLQKLEQVNGWVSPHLGIRFVLGAEDLEIYDPSGRKFLTSVELAQRAEQAELALDQERQRAERMAAYLRSLGIDEASIPKD